MAREHRLPPSAASLSASMRDLGYSLETAVADLIDNSISAGATEIEIFCTPAVADPALAIIDNGGGMDSDGLIAAMRHGVGNPRQPRAPGDLGRFGLGLKTASFSQCRRLTVISARKGSRGAAEWNLDLVDKRDDWIISIPDPEEIDGIPFLDHLPALSGDRWTGFSRMKPAAGATRSSTRSWTLSRSTWPSFFTASCPVR